MCEEKATARVDSNNTANDKTSDCFKTGYKKSYHAATKESSGARSDNTKTGYCGKNNGNCKTTSKNNYFSPIGFKNQRKCIGQGN